MNTTTVGGSPATMSRRIARGVTVTALTTILVAGLAACQTGKLTSSTDTSEGQRVDTSQRIDGAAAQLRALQEQYAGMPADRIEQAIADYTAAMRELTDASASTGQDSPREHRLPDRIE